jgi:benzodiazapine receptor
METVGAIAAVAGTAAASSYFTNKTVDSPWYACIRPEWAPVAIVFPIVWTTLYVLLIVAVRTSLLVDSTTVLVLHGVNLVLNVVWCWTFFGQKEVPKAVGVLLANLLAALGIVSLTRSDLVYYCLVPYIGWLCFATLLNVQSASNTTKCK